MPLHVAENIRTSGALYGSTIVSGNPLMAQNLTPSGIVFATTSGILQNSSSFLYNSTSSTLIVPNIAVTGMTPGSVLFIGASGQVSQANTHFYYDYNNNRLGVGINGTPAGKLHVDTDGSEQVTAVYVSNDDTVYNTRALHVLSRSSGIDMTLENYAADQSGVKIAYIYGSPTGTSFAPNGLFNADFQTFNSSSGLNTVARHKVGSINYGSSNYGGYVDFQSTTTSNTTLASHFVMSGGNNYSLGLNIRPLAASNTGLNIVGATSQSADLLRITDNSLNEWFSVGASDLIVNEIGADRDFRIESDTDSNLFNLDAGNDCIGIGGAASSVNRKLIAYCKNSGVLSNSSNFWTAFSTDISALSIASGVVDTGYRRGAVFYAYPDSASFSGNITSMFGQTIYCGVVSGAAGSGSVDFSYGLYIAAYSGGGGGNRIIEDVYGLFIEDLSDNLSLRNHIDGKTTFGISHVNTGEFTISVYGSVGPRYDNAFDLGNLSTPLRWRNAYFGTSGIFGSGISVGGSGVFLGRVTDKRVLFSSGNRIVEESGFYWDYTNKRLGINQGAPIARLQVTDGDIVVNRTDTSTRTIYMLDSGGVGSAFWEYQASRIRFGAGGINVPIHFRMGGLENIIYLSTGGLVGVGHSAPQSYLHTFQADTNVGTSAGITVEQSGTGDAVIQFLLTAAQRWVVGADNSDSDKFKICDGTDVGSNPILTITNAELVGINNSAPTSALQVANSAGSTTVRTFRVDGIASQTADFMGVFDSSSNELFSIGGSTNDLIINEAGLDRDFRIEGLTDASLFRLDAGLNSACFGGAPSSLAKLLVYCNEPTISGDDTQFYNASYMYLGGTNVSGGVTDSGYRRGIYVQGYPNTSSFIGTLANMSAIHIDNGTFGNNASGTITTSYGLRIVSYMEGTASVTNLWGLYVQDIDGVSKNYIQRDLRVGTTSNAGNFLANFAGHIGPQSDITYDLGASNLRWRGLYASSGIFASSVIVGGSGVLLGVVNDTQIAWASGNNRLVGTSAFVWDQTNSKLKIGTITTASGTLQVQPTGTTLAFISNPIARFQRGGGGNNYIDIISDTNFNYIITDDLGTNHKNLVNLIVCSGTDLNRSYNVYFVETAGRPSGITAYIERFSVRGTGNAGFNLAGSAPVAALEVRTANTAHYTMYLKGITAQAQDFMRVDDGSSNELCSIGTADTVFNEAGVDRDFRVESDTNANMLVVDAGLDSVGVGYLTPYNQRGVVLEANGSILSKYVYRTRPSQNLAGLWRDSATQSIIPWGRLSNRNSDFLMSTTGYYGTTFPTGYNLYNNSGARPELTASVINYSGAPNSSNKVMMLNYSGGAGGTSPGFGGFLCSTALGPSGNAINNFGRYIPGSRFLQVVWAKIPQGRSLNLGSNSIGVSGGSYFLTPTSGTDKWEKYVALRLIDESGTMGVTGYWYLTGGSDTSFAWYVASCENIAIDEGMPAHNQGLLNVGHKENFVMDWGNFLSIGNTYLATDTGNVTVATSGNPGSFRINVRGSVGPNDDNTWDLGSSSYRWRTIYAATGNIGDLQNVSGINGIAISSYLLGSGYSISGIAGNLSQSQVAFGASSANTVTGEGAFTWDTTNKKLAIASNTAHNAVVTISGNNAEKLALVCANNNATGIYLRFLETTGGSYSGGYIHWDSVANRLELGTHTAATTGYSDDVSSLNILMSNGYVGVGHPNPVSPLHVFENTSNTDLFTGLTIEQSGIGDSQLQFLLTGAQRWVMGIDNSDSDKLKIVKDADLSNSPFITMTTDSKIGLFTTADPSGYLHLVPTGNAVDIARFDNMSGSRLFAITTTGITFNDDALSRDFRIESFQDTNMLSIQGSSDSLGIGGSPYGVSSKAAIYIPTTGVISNTTVQRTALTIDATSVSVGSGFTDSGYRIGLTINELLSPTNMSGTLNRIIAQNIAHGTFGTGGAGRVIDSFGVYIGSYNQGSVIASNTWGLYVDDLTTSGSQHNVIIGDLRLGVATNAGSFKLNVQGDVGPSQTQTYRLGNGSYEWLSINAVTGTFSSYVSSPTGSFTQITTSAIADKQIAYGSGNVLVSSGLLVWDYTNARLGVGTGTPSATLHVKAVGSNLDGTELIRLEGERSWSFFQRGTGGSSYLHLTDNTGSKQFSIDTTNYFLKRNDTTGSGIITFYHGGTNGRTAIGNTQIRTAGTPGATVEIYGESGVKALSINAIKNDCDVSYNSSGTTNFWYMDASTDAMGFGAGGVSSLYAYLFQRTANAPAGLIDFRDTAGNSLFAINSSSFVFNEVGQDYDFRIEGDTNANLFTLDAGSDFVSFGSATNPGSFRVSVSGDLGPQADNVVYLGSSAFRWKALYATSGVFSSNVTVGGSGVLVGNIANTFVAFGSGAAVTGNPNLCFNYITNRMGIGSGANSPTGPSGYLHVWPSGSTSPSVVTGAPICTFGSSRHIHFYSDSNANYIFSDADLNAHQHFFNVIVTSGTNLNRNFYWASVADANKRAAVSTYNELFTIRGSGVAGFNMGNNQPAGALEIRTSGTSHYTLYLKGISSQTGDYLRIDNTADAFATELFSVGPSDVVVNEGGGARDFRVESSNLGNMIRVNATGDCLAINNSAPTTSGNIFNLVSNYPSVVNNSTNFMRSTDLYATTVNIASGVTDAGYRVLQWNNSYISNSGFRGTLTAQYGMVVQGGTFDGAQTPSGTITNVYGFYVSLSKGTACTHTNEWGIFQTGRGNNYFANDSRFGTTANAGSFTINSAGHVGPASNITYDLGSQTFKWRNIYGNSGIFDNISVSGSGLNLVVSYPGDVADKQIVFASGANQFAGNNLLYWNHINNRMGIHTTSPSGSLHVTSSSTTSPWVNPIARFQRGSTGGNWIDLAADATANYISTNELTTNQKSLVIDVGCSGFNMNLVTTFQFSVSGGTTTREVMRITGSGMAAMNTTTPTGTLTLLNHTGNPGVTTLWLKAVTNQTGPLIDMYNTSSQSLFSVTTSGVTVNGGHTALNFRVASDNNPTLFNTNGTSDYVTIGGTGNPGGFILVTSGNVGPESSGTRDIGSTNTYWNNLYVNNIWCRNVNGGSISGGGGTAGYPVSSGQVVFGSGNPTATLVGDSKLVWDNVNGRLGINYGTSPLHTMSIRTPSTTSFGVLIAGAVGQLFDLFNVVDSSSNEYIGVGVVDTVFNENAVDRDFRVETTGNPYAFFVDAGSGFVSMGGALNPGAFTLSMNGHLGPEASGTRDLGSSSYPWRNLYMANNSSIYYGGLAEVYGNNGTGNLSFATSNYLAFKVASGSTVTERYLMSTSGFVPWADNTYSLGMANRGWKNLYAYDLQSVTGINGIAIANYLNSGGVSGAGLSGVISSGCVLVGTNVGTISGNTNFAWDFTNNRLGINVGRAPLHTVAIQPASASTVGLHIVGQASQTSDLMVVVNNSSQEMFSIGSGDCVVNGGSTFMDFRVGSAGDSSLLRTSSNTDTVAIGTTPTSSFKFMVNGNIGPATSGGRSLGSTALAYGTLNLSHTGIITFNDQMFRYDGSQFVASTGVGVSGYIRVNDNVSGTPSISFINDTNTGFWRNGSDSIGYTAGGVGRYVLDTTKISPMQTVTYDLGASNAYWRKIYVDDVVCNTINGSAGGGGGIAGSIAAGQVAYGASANTIAGTNNHYWDNTNMRLGIGTNSPQYTLHLNAGALTNTYIALAPTVGSTEAGIKFVDPSNNELGYMALNIVNDIYIQNSSSARNIIFSTNGRQNASDPGAFQRTALRIHASGYSPWGYTFSTIGTTGVSAAIVLPSTGGPVTVTGASADLVIEDPNKGIIMLDKTLGTWHRITLNNGALEISSALA